jgi:hypothetical protein
MKLLIYLIIIRLYCHLWCAVRSFQKDPPLPSDVFRHRADGEFTLDSICAFTRDEHRLLKVFWECPTPAGVAVNTVRQ